MLQLICLAFYSSSLVSLVIEAITILDQSSLKETTILNLNYPPLFSLLSFDLLLFGVATAYCLFPAFLILCVFHSQFEFLYVYKPYLGSSSLFSGNFISILSYPHSLHLFSIHDYTTTAYTFSVSTLILSTPAASLKHIFQAIITCKLKILRANPIRSFNNKLSVVKHS